MRTTLIVENNLEIQSFLSLNLHTWVGSSVISQKSAKFAIEFLEDNPNQVELIITKSKNSTEQSAKAIFSYCQDKGINIPIIIIGNKEIEDDALIHLSSSLDIKPLVQAAAKSLNVTAKDMTALEVPDYFPVPIEHFNYITVPVCDVFEKDLTEELYSLQVAAFQEYSPLLIRKYITEGHSHFYVKKNDRLKFVTNISQEISSKLSLKDLNHDEQVTAVENSQHLLREKIARIGITQETIDLAQNNLKNMAQMAKKSSGISKLLKRLMKNKAGYQFKHSLILMYVSAHLMEHMDWGTDEGRQKLQFISFFHDISLENDGQAMIHSNEDLKASKLSAKEKEVVKNHAQKSAELVAKYPKAPMGVEQIITQHHGVTHGIGFSDHYAANLSPMTIVFVLAEDFVDGLIHSGKDFNLKKQITRMRERYSTQRFKKIIDTLEQIII